MDILSIAGLAVSGVSLFNDLSNTFRDLRSWKEKDVEVDSKWIGLAISKGVLVGSETDYAWPKENEVPSLELAGTHQTVLAFNDEKRIVYRLFRGNRYSPNGRLLLVRRV